jgi:ATP-dependent DNA ligase
MIKAIFDEIAAEGGSNKKMEILKSYKDSELLKRVLYLAKSRRVKFYVKQIPTYKPLADAGTFGGLGLALDSLSELSSRNVTGHAAIELLTKILSSLNVDDAYIIERIIEKDCKIGMGSSNINKVFPKLIEDTPYMGAKAFSEVLARKILSEGIAESQVKMDGRYANAIITENGVELESRQGEPTILDGAFLLKELAGLKVDCVLNGELTIDGMTRYESNGLIASLVSIGGKKRDGEDITKELKEVEKDYNMTFQEALDKIRFTAWDIIDLEDYDNGASKMLYKNRLLILKLMLIEKETKMVSLIETKTVKTYEEAMAHFQESLAKGLEGTVLKSINGTWKDGKPNWQVKMKLEIDVDLKIVGFNYGSGKNAKVISSVNAESACGQVFTRPTGMSEKLMRQITDSQDALLGTIVEVKCCGLSNDSTGKYSLLHPVFKALRDDKSTCDSLEDIQAIEEMAKKLK